MVFVANSSAGISPVKLLHLLNVPIKFCAFTVYLNNSGGIVQVNPVHFQNVWQKFEANGVLSNKPAGIVVNPVHPSKAALPIVVRLFDKVTSVNPVHA